VCGFIVAVKAFLAQAKEEFNKRWDEPAHVSQLCLFCLQTNLMWLITIHLIFC